MNETLSSVLELRNAQPIRSDAGLTALRYDLHLRAGECALIACDDRYRMARFVALCLGLVPLKSGRVTCLTLDWASLSPRRAGALRGRIGRTLCQGAWLDMYGMEMNIVLQQLYHARTPPAQVMAQAVMLSRRFGLPGLPLDMPDQLSESDREKAACVKAFLGEPDLLILEEPLQTTVRGTRDAFYAELTAARERGAAVIWLSAHPYVWQKYREYTSVKCFDLFEEGLIAPQGENP